DRGELHGRGPLRRRPGQRGLHRVGLQEDEVLGSHGPKGQGPGREEPPLLAFDELLEGEGEKDQGGRREGDQAPEADRRARDRRRKALPAPDRPPLGRPPGLETQRFAGVAFVGTGEGAGVGGGVTAFRNASWSSPTSPGSTANAPGRPETFA